MTCPYHLATGDASASRGSSLAIAIIVGALMQVTFASPRAHAEEAPPDLQTLRAALQDADVHVRRSAARDAIASGPAAVEVLPELLDTYDTRNHTTRLYVVRAVAGIGAPATAAVPLLLRALQEDASSSVRKAAADALGAVGVASPEVVATLAHAARNDAQAANRGAAINALAQLAPQARDARPALVSALIERLTEERLHYLRAAAANALGSIGPSAVEPGIGPALVGALEDPMPSVRRSALAALAELGPEARGLLPELRALERRATDERQTAMASVASQAIEAIESVAATPDDATPPRIDPPAQEPVIARGESPRTGTAPRIDVPVIEPEEPWPDDGWARSCESARTVGGDIHPGTRITTAGHVPSPGLDGWFVVRFPAPTSPGLVAPGVPTIELSRNDRDRYRFDLYANCQRAAVPRCAADPSDRHEDLTRWLHDDRKAVTTSSSGPGVRTCPFPERVYVRVRRTHGTENAGYELNFARPSYAAFDVAVEPEPEPSLRERAITAGTTREARSEPAPPAHEPEIERDARQVSTAPRIDVPVIEPEEPWPDDGWARSCESARAVGGDIHPGSRITTAGHVPSPGLDGWFVVRFPAPTSPGLVAPGVPTIELSRNDRDRYRFDLYANCQRAAVPRCAADPSDRHEDLTRWLHDDRKAVTTSSSGSGVRTCPFPERVYVRVRRTHGTENAGYELNFARPSYAAFDASVEP